MRLTDTETQKIIDVCRRNSVSFCALFGSFARGDAENDSDIDLLVRFSKPIGWKFYRIAEDLEESLGRRVDLATERMLNRHIRHDVMRHLEVIYEDSH